MSQVVRIRVVSTAFALLAILLCGSWGYMLLEGWEFGDGFFMTVITLSTVGYGETHELSNMGRWFTSLLIVMCFVGMTTWTAALTSFLVDTDLGGTLVRKRMLKMISKLSGHTIVCGVTLTAEVVIEQLVQSRKDVVVIDEDASKLERLRTRFSRVKTIEGSATNELSLAKANILKASHVVAAMPSEIDNLLISITCKDLREGISVYAESNDPTIANRMRKAGVEEVVCPSHICGSHLSNMILRTRTTDAATLAAC